MLVKAGVVAGFFVLSSATVVHADDEPGPTPPKYAGSEVSLNHLATYGTFSPGFEQTYNPTIVQSISIDPRWKLNKKVTLTGHLGIETELTDSDVSSYERQPLLEDVYVQGSYPLPKLPFLINGTAGLRLTLPTSKASIARSHVFALAPSIALNRSLKISDGITLTPFVSFRANFILATERYAQYDGDPVPGCRANTDNCGEFGGSRSHWLGLTEQIGVSADFPKDFSAQVVVGFIQNILYDLPPTEWQGMEIMDPNDGPNTRYIMLYVIEGAYQPWEHVKLSGGFQTVNGQQRLDSGYEAPFFNRYTQVFLKGTYVF